MIFLNKSYGEKKHVLVHKSYEELDDDEVVKKVLTHNKNNHYFFNAVSDTKSDEEVKENFLRDMLKMKLK